jgi:glycogen(starch) synthase
MKVLVIFPDSISKPTGGLGVQFKNIHSRLKDRVDFYVVGYPDEPNEIKNYIGVSHPIPAVKHGSVNTLLGHTVYLAEALKFPKPDFIHAYDWSTYFAGVYLAQIHKVPLLLSMQLSANAMVNAGITNCFDYSTVDGMWLHKAHVEMEWFGLTKADNIINVSNGYAKYFPQFADKTTIIPNGIDLKDWQPTEKVQLPGDRKYKVVYIGRISLMKSIDTLLDAEIPEDVDLIFVGSRNGGDVACVNKLEKQLADKKPGLHYYGPAYDQDKVNILHSADAVIMPSKHEPFGIVALEALASKSILLASRVDGLGDFLTNKNSIDCGYTANSITTALNYFTQLSDSQKTEMVQNGLQTCEEYKWNDIAERYYETYNSMINI